MKIVVLEGRTHLLVDGRVVDVERASGGRVPADPEQMLEHWDELASLAAEPADDARELPADAVLGLPLPRPRQIFGIGLNYADHGAETAMDLPTVPLVFPKWPTSVAGPTEEVVLRSETVDWETELVAVIGRDCFELDEDEAMGAIAGYTIGQDLSDRTIQFESGSNPQFGLGKSAPGYSPVGPWFVSADEIGAEPRLDIGCSVNGVVKQAGNTRDLIFGLPALVRHLSHRVRLQAGDWIFTGTPAGVGMARDPKEFLRPGDVIESRIEGLGTLTTRFAA